MKCSNPQYVPLPKKRDRDLRSLWFPKEFTGFVVPCGKCVSCVKSRQDDFACRIARCAAEYGSMIFVTFTYREDVLPISCRLLKVDLDTGEVVPSFERLLLHSSDFLNSLRYRFSLMPPGRKARYIYMDAPFPSQDGFAYMYEFTPSLNREDFRLWLKNERVKYERFYGEKLPSFKYCVVGEYGPKTCRPHMHCCFMGLTYSQVKEITSSWKENYGNVWIESVKRVNSDGSSGFLAASRYVGKYITKGVVECDSVKSGACEKPRLCASLRLGTTLSQSELFYYSAYDLYGIYDPDRLCFLDGMPLSRYQIGRIQSEVFKRSKINVDGRDFLLPRAIRDYIWKYYDKVFITQKSSLDEKSPFILSPSRRLRTYKIRQMAAVSASIDVLRKRAGELFNYIASEPARSVHDLVSQFEVSKASSSKVEESRREINFKACYSGSLF